MEEAKIKKILVGELKSLRRGRGLYGPDAFGDRSLIVAACGLDKEAAFKLIEDTLVLYPTMSDGLQALGFALNTPGTAPEDSPEEYRSDLTQRRQALAGIWHVSVRTFIRMEDVGVEILAGALSEEFFETSSYMESISKHYRDDDPAEMLKQAGDDLPGMVTVQASLLSRVSSQLEDLGKQIEALKRSNQKLASMVGVDPGQLERAFQS